MDEVFNFADLSPFGGFCCAKWGTHPIVLTRGFETTCSLPSFILFGEDKTLDQSRVLVSLADQGEEQERCVKHRGFFGISVPGLDCFRFPWSWDLRSLQSTIETQCGKQVEMQRNAQRAHFRRASVFGFKRTRRKRTLLPSDWTIHEAILSPYPWKLPRVEAVVAEGHRSEFTQLKHQWKYSVFVGLSVSPKFRFPMLLKALINPPLFFVSTVTHHTHRVRIEADRLADTSKTKLKWFCVW